MKKIPTVFVRDRATGYVTGEVTPGCEWVLAGEGVPTRKVDGTCCMFDGQDWWARREVKPGKTPPPGWTEVDRDEVTGKRVGWEPIEQSPFVKFWRQAIELATYGDSRWAPGTYELIGPRINGNPELAEYHELVPHDVRYLDISQWDLNYAVGSILGAKANPRGVVGLAALYGWEGIVWHHPDGRRAKLKVRDYPKPDDE